VSDSGIELSSLSLRFASRKRFFALRLCHSPNKTIEATSIPINTRPIFIPQLNQSFIRPLSELSKNPALPANLFLIYLLSLCLKT
jgi:hypothetical protein